MATDYQKAVTRIAGQGGLITVLTGAGISAESNIPTFRGPEGFWTIGSREYHPQQMATYQMFQRHPDRVWHWYLYRLGLCHRAQPNQGHLALVQMQRLLPGRFALITQNVDGLHLRAGNSPEATLQIHGNLFFMRCTDECCHDLYPVPLKLAREDRHGPLSPAELVKLRCPACGRRTRPHVLWFDETYNEHYYRARSALAIAAQTDLLLVVGTSGATSLPHSIAQQVVLRGGIIIDINLESNPFGQLAQQSAQGYFVQQPSSAVLAQLVLALQNQPAP